MKTNSSTRFYTKTWTNIIYSAAFTIVLELLAVSNMSYVAGKIAETQNQSGPFKGFTGADGIVLLLFIIAGIFIFATSFWFLQRKTLTYIDHIYESIKLISSGDLNVDVEVRGDDEFSDMASRLNSMVKDIRRIMDKEREAERSKNELITNVAHDLRTPLTSIIGYLSLLNQYDSLTEEKRRNYILIAYNKSKRLEKLIEDLFGFTKLNYGKIAMNIERFDLLMLLGQLVEECYPIFQEKELAFSLTSNRDAVPINADANLLMRLFDNLINNAIKYGAEGKRVDIFLEADEKTAKVTVRNYGSVIPEKDLPFLFDKFYRVESSRGGGTGGTGLGLAIAKNIVDMHRGSIEVSSSLGATSFVVLLKIDLDVDKEDFEHA